MARLVLTDASPLIGLDRVDGVPWLRRLFGRVEITHPVWLELGGAEEAEPSITGAIEEGWLVRRRAAPVRPPAPPHLGHGQWSTIRAAAAHRGESLVLLDDRLARRQARAEGLRIIGTAAVIAMAQRRGLVPYRLGGAVHRSVVDDDDAPYPVYGSVYLRGAVLHADARVDAWSLIRSRFRLYSA